MIRRPSGNHRRRREDTLQKMGAAFLVAAERVNDPPIVPRFFAPQKPSRWQRFMAWMSRSD